MRRTIGVQTPAVSALHLSSVKNGERRDIVVIGGSVGALDPLRNLLDLLPANLPASLFLTLHIPADYPSVLPELLSKPHKRVAKHPQEQESLSSGVLYVAPPNAHLVVERGRVVLGRGPRENRHRPAIDVLFRSAARAYRSRVVAIILSGQLDDGSAGMMAVKMRGGLTIVQDPAEAVAPEMPQRAIQSADPHYVLPIRKIAELLVSLTSEQLSPHETKEVSVSREDETRHATLERSAGEEPPGQPSAFACPECHGVLWEVQDGQMLRFRCRVGHAYTADALRVAMSEAGEDALWAARRTLEEKAALLRRLAARSTSRMRANYEEEAAGFDRHAETIGKMLVDSQNLAANEDDTAGAA